MAEIRFDDLEALNGQISEDYGPFGPPATLSQEKINQFAELTNDPQWIHVDVERCKTDSPFGTTIAHGFFVLSMLSGLQDGNDLHVTGQGMVINYGADKLRFVNPVPSGSDIHRRSKLVDVTQKKNGTQLTWESEITIVGLEKPSVFYRHIALFMAGA